MARFKELFFSFAHFVRNPNIPNYPTTPYNQKLIDVFLYFLLIQFIFGGIILWYPVAIAEKIGLFNSLASNKPPVGVILTIFSGVVLAPLIEEGLFRFPLGLYRKDPYFRWWYYTVSILFGFIHIFNYPVDRTHLFYIPFITMTQTFGGFLFGYIRIIYGIWYAVLLHSLFNILGFIWEYTIGFSL